MGYMISSYWEREKASCFVKELGSGFNLGNTLDTHDLHFKTDNPTDFETYWGNPVTTREMIEDIKAAGFNMLRIPVTWYEHMDENNLVDNDWFLRVQQIVDYGLEAGMYVIINAHHDRWYTPDDKYLPSAREKIVDLWSQIGERFKDYDHKLMFESMNEPRLIGEYEEWGEGTKRAREIINELNQIFVDTIRSVGGRNTDRYLLLPTYCARTDEMVLKDFKMPKDIQEARLIISVHLYEPFHFALDIEGTSEFFQEELSDTKELDRAFHDLNRYFIKKRIPVIITEFSAVDKKNEQHRVIWASYVRKKAQAFGIGTIWWDAGPGEEEGKPFPIYNRYTRKWLFPKLKEVLTK